MLVRSSLQRAPARRLRTSSVRRISAFSGLNPPTVTCAMTSEAVAPDISNREICDSNACRGRPEVCTCAEQSEGLVRNKHPTEGHGW